MRKGFSLIELLIVLAIIVCISAIALPALFSSSNPSPSLTLAAARALAPGTRVYIIRDRQTGVVLSVHNGPDDGQVMIRLRVRQSDWGYSEAEFFASELRAYP